MDELDAVSVLADRLQARGDARGELLSLELAAERATDNDEARRLNREAQRIRDAHWSLVWPEELADTKVGIRAGFVISGEFERLSQLPSERLLSLRALWVGREQVEPCLAALQSLRERGLSLDRLTLHSRYAGDPVDLSPIRALAAIAAPGPMVRSLSVGSEIVDIEALASLEGLRDCLFSSPLSGEQLQALAPIGLERLIFHTPALDAAFAAWLPTLERVHLQRSCGPLAPLAKLPRLRELHLPAGVGESFEMHQFAGLEAMTIGADLFRAAALLPKLRSLAVLGVRPGAEFDFSGLQALESLLVVAEGSVHVALGSAAASPKLRELDLVGRLAGPLSFTAPNLTLALRDMAGPVELRGDIVELALADCEDLRWIPSGVLANVRRLELDWFGEAQPEVLRALPRACPNLERLSIARREGTWGGADLPAILDALPRLRTVVLPDANNRELAELARACPQLCPYDHRWPLHAETS